MAKLTTCQDLKQGIVSDSLLLVRSAILDYIDRLPSNLHTPENLSSLVAYISKDCTDAVVFCYGCIYTYPQQSEIIISADSAGTTIKRVIDIYGHEYERMRFSGMHK